MQTIGAIAHLNIPSTISTELHGPDGVLRGNNAILALRDNLRSVLSDFPAADVMQGAKERHCTIVQCEVEGNSTN